MFDPWKLGTYSTPVCLLFLVSWHWLSVDHFPLSYSIFFSLSHVFPFVSFKAWGIRDLREPHFKKSGRQWISLWNWIESIKFEIMPVPQNSKPVKIYIISKLFSPNVCVCVCVCVCIHACFWNAVENCNVYTEIFAFQLGFIFFLITFDLFL